MTVGETEQLEQMSHGDLVALLKQLVLVNGQMAGQVEQLQARVVELENELDKLRRPPTNSRNSSQPPSRDQKSNLAEKKRKKHGPPFGHQRRTRELVEDPDKVIAVPVMECVHCEADLVGVEPTRIMRRQVTELPLIKPIVIETRQHEVRCPQCHKTSVTSLA